MVLVDGIHSSSLFNRNVWPSLGSRGSWTCEHGFGVRCSLTATGSFYILFFISVPLYDTLMSSEASRPPILICKSHFIASACTEEWHFYHFSHSVAASASFALAVTALSAQTWCFITDFCALSTCYTTVWLLFHIVDTLNRRPPHTGVDLALSGALICSAQHALFMHYYWSG